MLGENITVLNSVFSNTAGTPPAFGADLEPDHASYRFVNVSFRNCSFVGNQGGGISINMAALDHTAPPLSISFEDIEVNGGTNLPWVNAPIPKGAIYDQTGIGLASHSRPGENSLGSVTMRNVHVSDTLGAGLLVLGKPGVGGEWVALIDNITLENIRERFCKVALGSSQGGGASVRVYNARTSTPYPQPCYLLPILDRTVLVHYNTLSHTHTQRLKRLWVPDAFVHPLRPPAPPTRSAPLARRATLNPTHSAPNPFSRTPSLALRS